MWNTNIVCNIEYECIPHRVNFHFCEESLRLTPAILFTNAALRTKSLPTPEQGKGMCIKKYDDFMRSLYPLCMVWLFAEKHNKVWLLASDWLATPELYGNHF